MSVGINYGNICLISMIIPILFTIVMAIKKYKDKKLKLMMITISIITGIFTYFVIIYYVSKYFWHDREFKIIFNLLYLQLIILPITLFTLYFIRTYKKKIIKFILIIIIIISLLVFAMLNTYVVKVDSNYVEFEYNIIISSENQSSGYVLLPFVDSEYSIKIYDKLDSTGKNVIINIEETTKGNALNVSFDKLNQINSNVEIDENIEMDMYDHDDIGSYLWIYLNLNENDTLIIDFDFIIDCGASIEVWDFSGEMRHNGWNKIYGDIGLIMVA